MGLGDYLRLLDWTGRQIRSDKRGAMPANLEPLFERPGISTELWDDSVLNFRKWFRSNVGRSKSMEAETRGHNRVISISSARRAFAQTRVPGMSRKLPDLSRHQRTDGSVLTAAPSLPHC